MPVVDCSRSEKLSPTCFLDYKQLSYQGHLIGSLGRPKTVPRGISIVAALEANKLLSTVWMIARELNSFQITIIDSVESRGKARVKRFDSANRRPKLNESSDLHILALELGNSQTSNPLDKRIAHTTLRPKDKRKDPLQIDVVDSI